MLGAAPWAAALAALLFSGCTAAHYRRSADRDVYAIVQQVEDDIFGHTNAFTIDTPYSNRKPDEILAEEIIRDRQVPGALFLTLEQAIELAIRNSREYQSEKERVYLTALSLTGTRHEFRPNFFAGGSGSYARNSDGEWVGSANSQIGLSQFFKSGASLGVTLVNDFLRYYTGDPRSSAVSAISVNLVQPLLRGAGASIAAEQLTQAERNVVYSLRTYSQFQRQFVVDVVNDYFQLLQNRDQLVNAYEDYQRRLETIRYTEARGEAGEQSRLEVDEARSEELSAKNAYILAATNYRNNLDRFKLTLGVPLTTRIQLDNTTLEKLRAARVAQLPLDQTRVMQVAITNHLELLNDIDQYEDSKRKVHVAADRLKADLNLLAGASLSSQEPTDYTQFDLDKVRTSVGVELNLPLDRLRERNEYRTTLINFEAAIRTLSRQLDTKKDSIDRGLRQLEALRRTYVIQTNAVAIASRRVTGEQLSLQAGRRTVRDVRDAQDSLVRAQNSVTAALVDHLAGRLQLFLDIGVLETDRAQFWTQSDAYSIPLEQLESREGPLPQTEEVLTPEQVLQL